MVDQSRRQFTQVESIQVQFFRREGETSTGFLKLAGLSTSDSWAYPVCGYPGERVRANLAGDADPSNIEIIRCSNPKDIRSMPVAFFIKTKDGSAFRYAARLLDPWNKSLDVTTGRLLVINWGPQRQSSYVLESERNQ